jgi:hypothetical protein
LGRLSAPTASRIVTDPHFPSPALLCRILPAVILVAAAGCDSATHERPDDASSPALRVSGPEPPPVPKLREVSPDKPVEGAPTTPPATVDTVTEARETAPDRPLRFEDSICLWLADHQCDDGAWRAGRLVEAGAAHGRSGSTARADGRDLPPVQSDPLIDTSLALLAFLDEGYDHRTNESSSPHALRFHRAVQRGLRFLMNAVPPPDGSADPSPLAAATVAWALTYAWGLSGAQFLRDSAAEWIAVLDRVRARTAESRPASAADVLADIAALQVVHTLTWAGEIPGIDTAARIDRLNRRAGLSPEALPAGKVERARMARLLAAHRLMIANDTRGGPSAEAPRHEWPEYDDCVRAWFVDGVFPTTDAPGSVPWVDLWVGSDTFARVGTAAYTEWNWRKDAVLTDRLRRDVPPPDEGLHACAGSYDPAAVDPDVIGGPRELLGNRIASTALGLLAWNCWNSWRRSVEFRRGLDRIPADLPVPPGAARPAAESNESNDH